MPMIMANERQLAAYDFPFVLNSNHSSIYVRYGDINDLKFSRSKPFQGLPAIIAPLWPIGSTTSMGFPI